MKSTLDIVEGVGSLKLSEGITIENSKEFKAALINALKKCNELTVDIRKVTNADVSCLQLFCSLCRNDRKLFIRGLDSKVFTNLINDAGLNYTRQCYFKKTETCLLSTKKS